jgi:hypothetical protein
MVETIIQGLQEAGWNLQRASNGIYYTRYLGKNSELIVHLNILNLDNSTLLAIAYLPIKVMPHQIDKVARFLNELNLKNFFGSFEMDYKIGEIAFRTGIFYFNTEFQMPMVINCLDAAVYSADMDYPSILEIIKSS